MKYTSVMSSLLLSLFLGLSCNAYLVEATTPLGDIEQQIKQELAEKKFVPLASFMPLFKADKIPAPIRAALDKVEIADPIVKVRGNVLQLTGIGKYNNLQISIDFKLDKSKVMPTAHFSVFLPQGAKASDISDKLKKLDIMAFDTTGFYISNHEYKDPLFGVEVREGLTYAAGVSFNNLIDQISEKLDAKVDKDAFKKGLKKFIVLEDLGLHWSGYIPPTMANIILRLEIPIELGFDFAALKTKNGKPLFNNPLITKITFSSIQVEIALKDFEPEITITNGIKIYPRSQTTPLEFRAGGSISQSGISMKGWMEGSFDPAFGLKWLAIGSPEVPMGIDIYFDYVLSSAIAVLCGVPLPTGITISGGLGLGKVPYRTMGSAAIKLQLKSAGISEFIFNGKVDQIDIAHLISILASIAGKEIKVGADIPEIKFSDLELAIAPFGGDILGVEYKSGFEAGAAIQLGKFKAKGLFALGTTPSDPRIVVEGEMDPFAIKTKRGETILSLGGSDLKDTDDKAKLGMMFSPKEPFEINIDGGISIPVLKTAGGIKFEFDGNVMNGKSALSFMDNAFGGEASLSFALNDPSNFTFSCGLNNERFGSYAIDNLKKAFAVLRKETEAKIAQLEKQIKEADISGKFEVKAKDELARVEQRIADLKEDLKEFNPPAVGELKKSSETNLHMSNHTGNKIYAGLYIYNKKTKIGELFGKIIELQPMTKNQLERPKFNLVERRTKDRDIIISQNKSDLTPTLADARYDILTWQNAGSTRGSSFHILKDKNQFTIKNKATWFIDQGDDLLKLNTELALLNTYKEALLKPGTKVVSESLESVEKIALQGEKIIEQSFALVANKVLPLLEKGVKAITITSASIETSGKDLVALKLPAISLEMEINLPKEKTLTLNIQDLQFDFTNPLEFFKGLAKMITLKLTTK